jgi:hypothetical protein
MSDIHAIGKGAFHVGHFQKTGKDLSKIFFAIQASSR